MSETPANSFFSQQLTQLRHDLRTPVGHIKGYAEMLLEDIEEVEDKRHGAIVRDLRQVISTGESILSLIDEHLGPAHSTLADLDIQQTSYRMRMLLNSVDGYTEMLAEEAEELGEDELIPDLDRIRSAAVNLLSMTQQKLSEDYFTAADQEQTDAPEKVITQLPDDLPTPWQEGGRILIVDDDPGNRDLIKRQLKRRGYDCWTADSGKNAIEWLEQNECDVVLLDLIMPGMNGQETLEVIKANHRLRNLPVIMLSANDDMDPVVSCILHGAEDFLMKPCNPILLRARLSATMEKERLRRLQGRVIKVFISSSGDVIPERRLIRRVLQNVSDSTDGRVRLVPILWEEEPLLASDTFQAQIESAADADIYIGILWSRIGSPLPPHITREDGSLYESGTVFEFEEALHASRASGKPDMLIYRKTAPITVELTDREEVLDRLNQRDDLNVWLDKQLKSKDGLSFESAFHTFDSEDALEEILATHLHKLIERNYLE